MMQADRLLFIASSLLEARPTLKERQLLCDEISRISDTVRRMEEALDAAVGSAREDVLVAQASNEATLLRMRRKPQLRAIAGGRAEFGM
jgi:hypothetical protein